MERKNTVLLTVIAVATLLVAVVGATFAYFTATSNNTGTGTGAVDAATPQVADSAALDTNTSKSSDPYYPGTINYATATVSANKADTVNTNVALDVKYEITGSVTIPTELGSDVTWTLYRSTTEIDPVIVADSCGASAHVDGTGTKYYQECALNSKFTATPAEGETKPVVVKTGTTSDASISDTGTLTTGTGATGGQTVYYYLVVSYANKQDAEGVSGNQNAQQGKTISFQLNKAEAKATTTHTGS